MSRFFARLSVPAVAAVFAFLGATAPARADAPHDVRIVNMPTGIPLHSDTYLENVNDARIVVADVQEQTFQGARPVGSPIVHSYELKPGEKRLIGHEQDSLLTTTFKLVGAHYEE